MEPRRVRYKPLDIDWVGADASLIINRTEHYQTHTISCEEILMICPAQSVKSSGILGISCEWYHQARTLQRLLRPGVKLASATRSRDGHSARFPARALLSSSSSTVSLHTQGTLDDLRVTLGVVSPRDLIRGNDISNGEIRCALLAVPSQTLRSGQSA